MVHLHEASNLNSIVCYLENMFTLLSYHFKGLVRVNNISVIH